MRTEWTTCTDGQETGIAVSVKVVNLTAEDSADELCDELMKHIFDCDACIAGSERSCVTFVSLAQQIAAMGGATRGALLAA